MADAVRPVRVRVVSDFSDATGRYFANQLVELAPEQAARWLELKLVALARPEPEHTAHAPEVERAVQPRARPKRGRPLKRR